MVGKLEVSPAGPPFVACHGMAGHSMDMEIGFTFAQKLKGKDNIQAGEILGGKSASCIHIGPYDMLGGARAALHQWMLKNNYKVTGVAYDFYFSDRRQHRLTNWRPRLWFQLNRPQI